MIVQLTFEQQICTGLVHLHVDFFSVSTTYIHGWLNATIQNCGFVGQIIKLYTGFRLPWEVSAPQFYVIHGSTILQFNHLPMKRTFSCLLVLLICCYEHSHAGFCVDIVFISLGSCLVFFKKLPNYFPQFLQYFTCATAVYEYFPQFLHILHVQQQYMSDPIFLYLHQQLVLSLKKKSQLF